MATGPSLVSRKPGPQEKAGFQTLTAQIKARPMTDESNTSRDPAEAIFDAAVQLPPADRGPFLDRSCGADIPLRSRVETLLKAHDAAGGFLDEPVAAPMQKTVCLLYTSDAADERSS